VILVWTKNRPCPSPLLESSLQQQLHPLIKAEGLLLQVPLLDPFMPEVEVKEMNLKPPQVPLSDTGIRIWNLIRFGKWLRENDKIYSCPQSHCA
jgi:hypothetical protein